MARSNVRGVGTAIHHRRAPCRTEFVLLSCYSCGTMNLPPTNFRPPLNITRASHLVMTSRDLAKARDFYTEVIGLKVSEESATTIYFRGVEERAHHSLTLKKTKDEPACERVGFRVFEEEDLEKAKAHFDRTGIPAKSVNV